MNVLDVDIKYKVGQFKGNYRFAISHGVTGIWGPSGHGKTNLIQLISGLLKPAQGTIAVRGKVVIDRNHHIFVPPHKRNIGVVFQEARLFPHLSVKKNLLYGMPAKTECHINYDDVVEVLGLNTLLDQMPGQCSGGEKQRVAIGRALLSQPQLLLLDEPFSALDKQLKLKAIDFIRKVIRKFEIPVVVISHDISDILNLTKHMLLIKNGKVQAEGNFSELLMQGYFEGTAFSNTFVNDLQFAVVSQETAMNYKVKLRGTDHIYYLHTETKPLKEGDYIDAFLCPDDITIATHHVHGISMQNQLEATVTEIYMDKNYALCLLDVGTELLVQITRDSVDRLNIRKGSTVYALFKSVALTMYDDSLRMSRIK